MEFRLVEQLDTNNRELTLEQSDYFSKSKMIENGKLIVFHHGEDKEKREKFNCSSYPYFFSKSEVYSKEYGNNVSQFYLNISNPFDLSDEKQYSILVNEFSMYADKRGIEPLSMNEIKIGNYVPFPLVDTLYSYLRHYSSYDGIIAQEYSSTSNYYNQFGESGMLSYIPFYSNQIKLTTNLSPTDSIYIGE